MELTPEEQLANITQMRMNLHQMEQTYAERMCPHKVGDVFVSKNGYRARVTKIRWSFLRPHWAVYGSIIRSNGTLVNKEIQLYEGDGSWRKQ